MVIDGPAEAALAAGRLLATPRTVHGVNTIGAALVPGVSLIDDFGGLGDLRDYLAIRDTRAVFLGPGARPR